MLELKDKLTGALASGAVSTVSSTSTDIINALMGLGYSDREARAVVKKLPADISVSDGIRMALQQMVK